MTQSEHQAFKVGNDHGMLEGFSEPLARVPASFISQYFYELHNFLFKPLGTTDQNPADPLLMELGGFYGYMLVGSMINGQLKANETQQSQMVAGLSWESRVERFIEAINQLGLGNWKVEEPLKRNPMRFQVFNSFEIKPFIKQNVPLNQIRCYLSLGIAWAMHYFSKINQEVALSWNNFRAIYYDQQHLFQSQSSINIEDGRYIIHLSLE